MPRTLFAALACLNVATGCATILAGTTSEVAISTSPAAADVVIASQAGVVFQATTPATARLSKEHEYTVTVIREGYRPQTVPILHTGIEKWSYANLWFVLGWGVDYWTGALYRLEPSRIELRLHTAQMEAETTVATTVDVVGGSPGGAADPVRADPSGRPPLTASSIGKQYLTAYLGMFGGAALMLPGLLASYVLDNAIPAYVAFYIGIPAGAAYGAYRSGCGDGVTGSYWASLAGAALLAIPAAIPSEGIGMFYAAPVGAVLGYSASRRYGPCDGIGGISAPKTIPEPSAAVQK